MDITLVVFKPDGTRRAIPLKLGSYLVGRGADANFRIPLPSVSRKHCRLTIKADSMQISDLGSSNGTLRNHEPIEESEVVAGDIIGIGDCLITVQFDGLPDVTDAPVPPPVAQPPGNGEVPGVAGLDDTPVDDLQSSTDPDATSPKGTGMGSLTSDIAGDDSSIFDFDFDFDDDDAPKL